MLPQFARRSPRRVSVSAARCIFLLFCSQPLPPSSARVYTRSSGCNKKTRRLCGSRLDVEAIGTTSGVDGGGSSSDDKLCHARRRSPTLVMLLSARTHARLQRRRRVQALADDRTDDLVAVCDQTTTDDRACWRCSRSLARRCAADAPDCGAASPWRQQ